MRNGLATGDDREGIDGDGICDAGTWISGVGRLRFRETDV